MRASLVALALLVLAACASPALAGGGPAETVVLVNTKSPDSRKVADYYAEKRDIPRAQICEVKCGAGLETSMDDFVRDVVDPLRKFLHERGLEDRCRFVVLTQGMPILAHTPGGAVSTAAALSVLDTPICGRPQTYADIARTNVRNPYRDGSAPTGPILDGGRFLLVAALIATTADEATALIDRSVASDGTAPKAARFIFQDAGGAAAVRNDRYDAARRDLESAGFAAERDPAGAESATRRDRVMGYMSGGAYSGLSVAGVNSDKYLPGAICDMLESYGAVPANFGTDAAKYAQFSVTHMIRAGVTGVHGAVSEPFNFAFPDVTLFRRYAEGYTLAEAFHQTLPIVYWMNLTIGDPLCAPYAKRIRPTIDAKSVGDMLRIAVAAPGAVRIDVYVDGRSAGRVEGESGTVTIDPAAWPTAPRHVALVEATGPGPAEPRGWSVADVPLDDAKPRALRPPPLHCDRLVVETPSVLRAGDAGALRVVAGDAAGKPLDGWSGRIEVRSVSPPVRWATIDATSPETAIPLTFTTAGDYDLRVAAPDDGRETSATIRVEPAAFDHVTAPAESSPLCQEDDLVVVVEDRFGNRLRNWEGSVAVEVPQDPSAQLPRPVAITAADHGRGVLRGLLIDRAGPTRLVFKDAAGAVLSLPGEGVSVEKAAVRAWLVAGPAPEKSLDASDPASSATGEGSTVAKLVLRRRAGGDVVELPPGDAKGGDAALLVTWIESVGETKARLLAAAPGRLRVLLDGKTVFDGVSKATDPGGRRDPVAAMTLAAGAHRLVVVAATKGATSASFEIDDGAGRFPTSLRIRASAN